jgi:hypothetical protein
LPAIGLDDYTTKKVRLTILKTKPTTMKPKIIILLAISVATAIFGFTSISTNQSDKPKEYINVSLDMHKAEIVINFGNGKIEKIEKASTDAQYLDVINRLHKDGYELIETNTVVTVQQSSGYLGQTVISTMVK